MFDIGFTELLIVGIVALIVLGPEKLPTALRTLGLWLGRIRRSVSNVQREISEELRLEEVRRAAQEQQQQLGQQVEDLQKPFGESLRDEILSAPSTTPQSPNQASPATAPPAAPVASPAQAAKGDSPTLEQRQASAENSAGGNKSAENRKDEQQRAVE